MARQVRPDVGDVIRELRVHRVSITQAQLARAMGVEQMTVSRWERGLSQPSRTNLATLGEIFRVSQDEFYANPEEGPSS